MANAVILYAIPIIIALFLIGIGLIFSYNHNTQEFMNNISGTFIISGAAFLGLFASIIVSNLEVSRNVKRIEGIYVQQVFILSNQITEELLKYYVLMPPGESETSCERNGYQSLAATRLRGYSRVAVPKPFEIVSSVMQLAQRMPLELQAAMWEYPASVETDERRVAAAAEMLVAGRCDTRVVTEAHDRLGDILRRTTSLAVKMCEWAERDGLSEALNTDLWVYLRSSDTLQGPRLLSPHGCAQFEEMLKSYT